ncbi:MAG: hypothetical protein OFPI_17690 [Osedax symbiont Rs2]|nr:MAG: hypothetical protein OFPI_17690 [Osedax symbiont Rs2]
MSFNAFYYKISRPKLVQPLAPCYMAVPLEAGSILVAGQA